MKTRPLDRMRDPFFAQLMFSIEDLVCTADSKARGKEIVLKDSQILFTLTKAQGLISGKQPHINDSTESDRILRNLIFAISQLTANPDSRVLEPLEEGLLEPVSKKDSRLTIEAVRKRASNELLTFGRSTREDSMESEVRTWRGLDALPHTDMEIMSRINS